MKYLKVKKNTKQWDMFYRYWNQEKNWMENELAIEQLIGCPMRKNLAMSTTQLVLSNPPEQLRDQFSKNPKGGRYYAKKNSLINRMWVDFAKLKNLDSYSITELTLETGLFHTPAKQYYPEIYGDYYISWKDDEVSEKVKEWCDVIDEPTFLRLYADWKEENEKQKEMIANG